MLYILSPSRNFVNPCFTKPDHGHNIVWYTYGMTKAIIYDFDGTLTPDLFPRFEILERSGLKGGMFNPKFMEASKTKAKQENRELFEAMILVILDTVKGAGYKTTDQNIALGASTRSYNPGVEEFLHATQEKGVKNYIISSGSKAYLEQTVVAPYFQEIYASILKYNNTGEAIGVEFTMTEQQKAKAIRKIAKNINGDDNDCSDIVYIGDGMTDLPAMEFIKKHGGKNILVYLDADSEDVVKLRKTGVIDNFVSADFRPSSELWQLFF